MSCISVVTSTNQFNNADNDAESEYYDEKKRRMSMATDNKSSIMKTVTTEGHAYDITNDNTDQNAINAELQQNYDSIHKIINDIYFKFFEKECQLELNIPERIIKKIKRNLQNFNDNYEKMKTNQSYSQEGLLCERIYDEAHREAIETLYHNAFSNYLIYKRNGQMGIDLSTSKEIVDADTISIKRNLV
ncbi:hypothetical protein PIROE2DRAFT_57977 [Piromyces sp. E2]|nr:hypothetical protein PIROE2DRAFT_57977 [Piromyces sp. E2]|eukprot:OUM68531.1 hypothetical protein PIROE2DRAFT_57977 [Piromyces sp. E2]